jgi:hypothetical protein
MALGDILAVISWEIHIQSHPFSLRSSPQKLNEKVKGHCFKLLKPGKIVVDIIRACVNSSNNPTMMPLADKSSSLPEFLICEPAFLNFLRIKEFDM